MSVFVVVKVMVESVVVQYSIFVCFIRQSRMCVTACERVLY